jgi:hypothetical protein
MAACHTFPHNSTRQGSLMSDIAITLLHAPKTSNLDKIGHTEQDHASLDENIIEIVGHFLNTRTSHYPEYTAPAKITLVRQTASAKILSSLDLLVLVSVPSDHDSDKRIDLQDVIRDTIAAVYAGIKANVLISFGPATTKSSHPRTVVLATEEDRAKEQRAHAQLVTRLMIKTNEDKPASNADLVDSLVSSES